MPEWAELQRQTGQRYSNRQLQDPRKKTDRAITPAEGAVRVPVYMTLPASLPAKQLRNLHVQLSLGQSCHRPKKSCIYVHRVAWVVSDSLRPYRLWPARLLCQGGGVLQARILEHIGQYWLPYPSRALYFLLPSHQLP